MVTSKRAKKPPMTLNLIKARVFDTQSKTTIRFLQHETAKNYFFKLVSFAPVERKIDGDMADFMAKF